ncbi:MAG: CHAT domain-containing protein, partial [bacterium]|nr:CHAT domain-containing protein [bacterium]
MQKKILILTASPTNRARLRLDREVRDIQEGLRLSEHRDRFQVT